MKKTLTVDMTLQNGKVYIKSEIVEAGIAVDDGKIVRIAKKTNLPSSSKIVDLNGCLVFPGLIDAHVHLRGQLQSYEEDFFTGTAAAVAGGVTLVLDMPNNEPVTKDSASLRKRMEIAERSIVSNVGFYSAFPESLEEIREVVEEGAIAFKLYLTSQVGGLDIDDNRALVMAFSEVGELGVPIAVHAEDKETVETVAEAEQRLGNNGYEAYLRAHTLEVEAKAVERILRVAQRCNVQVHFCHISSKKAVNLIHNASKNGLRVSCEISPHHLSLTSEDLKRHGTMMLTDPPVRSKDIVKALWNAVRNGQIDIIASDHAPHLITEKTTDSVWNVKPGIPGLETTLPLLLTKVNEGKLTVNHLVRLTAEKPAEIFNLHGNGLLKDGYNANFTVIDLHRQGRIDASRFFSKAKYSPFNGWRVKGVPVKTFVNGQLVMDEGEIVAEAGVGSVLRSKPSR